MATPDRLERLTDLVLLLLHSSSARTLDEIARAVPGYPESHAARRQAFERDKRVLREEGIPVVTEPVEGPDQYGYRIDPETFYLGDLGLSPDEQAALHLAVAGVHLGDPSGRDALAKLGTTGVADAVLVAAIVPPPALAALFDALGTQSDVRFEYRGTLREVVPVTLRFSGGRWYLLAWDRARAAARTFRVDRIEGAVRAGAPGSGALPPGVELDGRDPRPEEREHVLVWVDAVEAPRVVAEVGESALSERTPDGAVLLRLETGNFDVFRSWVLGLCDHAEVIGPPEARLAIRTWLEKARRAPGQLAPLPTASPGRASVATGAASDLSAISAPVATGASGPRVATRARLRRLLAIVAWLAEVDHATVEEIGERFEIPAHEVVHELELAACCGVPPYSPDALLEIVVDEGAVQAFLPRELARPRRLTPREGLALAAAVRTILAVPGADREGALARALAKLEVVLGDHGRLVIELDAPPALDEVRNLARSGLQAVIEYRSASADETTERTVEPIGVVSLDGHWYLDAYCHRALDVRRFRVDRIRTLRVLDEPVSPLRRRALVGADAFVPGPGATEVVLRVQPGARWVADSVPVLRVEEHSDGSLDLTLAIGGRAWLERLLLQLGPDARVIAPENLTTLGAEAADRLLRRYR